MVLEGSVKQKHCKRTCLTDFLVRKLLFVEVSSNSKLTTELREYMEYGTILTEIFPNIYMKSHYPAVLLGVPVIQEKEPGIVTVDPELYLYDSFSGWFPCSY